MAHPDNPEAVGSFDNTNDAAAAFERVLAAESGEPEIDSDEPEGDDPEGEAPDEELSDEELDDEQDSDEPETAIEAPASLTADEKAKFAQLDPEAQRMLVEVETRRNSQVQAATTKAAEAQRMAEARAAEADAEAKAVYANQLKVVADAIAPQKPDPVLAQTDPARYIALNAQYEADLAQHNDFVQQVMTLGQEADTEARKAFIEARDRDFAAIPEVANEATREQFFSKAIETAKSIGLDMQQLENATAGEWKALRDISDWKAKAEKLDRLMSRKMERVRSGKSTKPGAAPVKGNRLSQVERQFAEAPSRDSAAALLAQVL